MTKLRALVILSAIILIACFALTIYGIFHSFDWTDEAWTYSLIANGRISPGEPWAYQYLLHPLFDFLGQSIVAFRFVRLTVFVLLGLFGSYVATRILRLHNYILSTEAKSLVYLSAQIGTILIWSWPPRGFAYNELASAAFQCMIFLLAFSYVISLEGFTRSGRFSAFPFGGLVWFLTGLSTAILFFAKFVPFFAGLLILACAPFAIQHSRRLISFIWAFLGLASGLLLPGFLGVPTLLYMQSVLANIFDEKVREANAHSSELVEMYLDNLGFIAVQYVPIMIVIAACLIWIDRSGRQSGTFFLRRGLVPSLILIATILYAVIFVVVSGFGPSGTGALALSIVFGAAGVLISLAFKPKTSRSHWRGSKRRKPILFLCMLAFSTPFLIAAGTNNPLMDHLGFEATIWGVVFGATLAIHMDNLDHEKSKLNLAPAIVLLLAMVLTSYLSLMHFRNPYRAPSIRLTNSLSQNDAMFSQLGLSEEEARWVDWLRASAKELHAEDSPTISLNSPGALLAFNNSDYASPWLATIAPASYDTLALACRTALPTDLVVLQPNVSMNPESVKLLKSTLAKDCNLRFPYDFRLVKTFDSKDARFGMAIWQQK